MLYVLATGGSRGLGFALVKAFLTSIPCPRETVHLILVARNLVNLNKAKEVLQDEFEGLQVSCLPKDLSCSRQIEQLCDQLDTMLFAQVKKEDKWFVIAAAGVHEPPVSGGPGSWRYSTNEDFTSNEIAKFRNVNVQAPIAILQLHKRLDLPFTMLYLSSQAAEEKWWDKGNSIYGKQKKQAENELTKEIKESNGTLYCFRYPFVDSDMAHHLYNELSKVEDLPSQKSIFLKAEEVAQNSVSFITNPTGFQYFKRLTHTVFHYQ